MESIYIVQSLYCWRVLNTGEWLQAIPIYRPFVGHFRTSSPRKEADLQPDFPQPKTPNMKTLPPIHEMIDEIHRRLAVFFNLTMWNEANHRPPVCLKSIADGRHFAKRAVWPFPYRMGVKLVVMVFVAASRKHSPADTPPVNRLAAELLDAMIDSAITPPCVAQFAESFSTSGVV